MFEYIFRPLGQGHSNITVLLFDIYSYIWYTFTLNVNRQANSKHAVRAVFLLPELRQISWHALKDAQCGARLWPIND